MSKSKRLSNLELLRIITMLVIIAHHYIVNSGVTELYDFQHISGKMIFAQCFGWGGKTAINIFVLISAYFMCQSKLTWKKVLKLYLEIKFYSIVIYAIFLVTGYTTFSVKGVLKTIFNVALGVENSFTGSFIAFYLLIPFLKKIIQGISQKAHLKLCGILVFVFTMISTFSVVNDTYSYIGWYSTLFFIASYIRLYPNKFTECKKYALCGVIVSLLLSFISIVVIDFIGAKVGIEDAYYMFSDSHKLLALALSVTTFILFKNINIKYNKYINLVASCTFGIFLIHTRGDEMRHFLWQTLLNNKGAYAQSWFVIHAICAVVGIFIVCGIIDIIRQKSLEKPLFDKIGEKSFLNKECFMNDEKD